MDGPRRDKAALAGGSVGTSNNYLPVNGSALCKRLPPYSKPTAQLRAAGRRPARETVFVSFGWPECVPLRTSFGLAAIPIDTPPSMYEWSFVRDLSVVVRVHRTFTPPATLRSALQEIVRAEPSYLHVADIERERMWCIKTPAGIEVRL